MKKKALLTFVIFIVFTISNSCFGEMIQSGDWLYQILEDGTFYLEDYLGNDTDVVIPAVIDGYPVTTLAPEAFWDNESPVSITIPQSIIVIDKYDAETEEKNGVSSVLTQNPFAGCKNLEKIIVSPDNPVFFSDDGVLINKNENELITYPTAKQQNSYTVPDCVTSIAMNAFFSNQSLVSITLPDSVRNIGSNPFTECKNLKRINLSETYQKYAFYENALVDIAEHKLIAYLEGSAETSYQVPEGIVSIGESAFGNNQNLLSVIIPDGVAYIRNYAFYNCSGLSSVILPESLRSVGIGAFKRCTGMTSMIIPEKVTEIGNEAFAYDRHLKSVIFNGNTSSIGVGTFYDCEDLYSVKLPKGLETIPYLAFSNCRSLRSVILPEGLLKIEEEAFGDCYNLQVVVVPDSLNEIGSNAFVSPLVNRDIIFVHNNYDPDSFIEKWADEKGYQIAADTDGSIQNQLSEHHTESLALAYNYYGIPEVLQIGDFFSFGHYEQDNEEWPVPRRESIIWQVADIQDGKALVISKDVLDAKAYNDKNTIRELFKIDTTWEECSLRKWLNEDFFNSAFRPGEQSRIVEVINTNPDNPVSGTKGGKDTLDRIFLFGIDDANRYMDIIDNNNSKVTSFARSKGVTAEDNGYFFWLLRSPGYSKGTAAGADSHGNIYYKEKYDGGTDKTSEAAGIRPAMWVTLNSENRQPSRVLKLMETLEQMPAIHLNYRENYRYITDGRESADDFTYDIHRKGNAIYANSNNFPYDRHPVLLIDNTFFDISSENNAISGEKHVAPGLNSLRVFSLYDAVYTYSRPADAEEIREINGITCHAEIFEPAGDSPEEIFCFDDDGNLLYLFSGDLEMEGETVKNGTLITINTIDDAVDDTLLDLPAYQPES